MFFDIVDPAVAKMPGYVVVNYYVGEKPVMGIEINVWTGQVVDKDRCIYFRSASILSFEKQVRDLTHLKQIPWDKLAEQIGCDKLVPAGEWQK